MSHSSLNFPWARGDCFCNCSLLFCSLSHCSLTVLSPTALSLTALFHSLPSSKNSCVLYDCPHSHSDILKYSFATLTQQKWRVGSLPGLWWEQYPIEYLASPYTAPSSVPIKHFSPVVRTENASFPSAPWASPSQCEPLPKYWFEHLNV